MFVPKLIEPLRFSPRIAQRAFSTSYASFAGHAKWQNIKHRKARQDASRSTQNTKIAHAIYVACKEGGGSDPALNIRLATAIENAAKISIPKKVIESAIARAVKSSENPGENAQSIAYEGVGPGGVAYIVEVLTENKNRTAQQVRAAFLKYNGSLSPTSFLFKKRGWIEIDPGNKDFDTVFEDCLQIESVEDVLENDDGTVTVYLDPTDLSPGANLIRKQYKISDMGLGYMPDEEQASQIEDEEVLQKLAKFETELDKIDDVNNVYNNLART